MSITLLIILVISIILFVASIKLFRFVKKKKKLTIGIIGPSDGGKTVLFYRV
jgi:hypothetical protein